LLCHEKQAIDVLLRSEADVRHKQSKADVKLLRVVAWAEAEKLCKERDCTSDDERMHMIGESTLLGSSTCLQIYVATCKLCGEQHVGQNLAVLTKTPRLKRFCFSAKLLSSDVKTVWR